MVLRCVGGRSYHLEGVQPMAGGAALGRCVGGRSYRPMAGGGRCVGGRSYHLAANGR